LTDIKELTQEQLVAWLESHKISSYRALQILKWIYLKQADTFEVMTDLKKDIRSLLSEHFIINRLEKRKIEASQDGSKKYLFKLSDGKYIESVLIPEKDHYTLCISAQVGCAQGCKFCLTAKGGFKRNLTPGEIIAQIRDINNDMTEDPKPLTNIVFMGMGEPLANYENLIQAVPVITNAEWGLNFSTRRVTVSTAGLVPRMADLGHDTKVNIAVSLNATEDETRNMLMPVNRKYPLKELLDACKNYQLLPRRRITIEYILIKGVNDSVKNARQLVQLLSNIKSKINLIPFNEHEGSDFKRPDDDAILCFQEFLAEHNYTVMLRQSKGKDISAACGQLGAGLN